jgi:hypothetical protein
MPVDVGQTGASVHDRAGDGHCRRVNGQRTTDVSCERVQKSGKAGEGGRWIAADGESSRPELAALEEADERLGSADVSGQHDGRHRSSRPGGHRFS